MVRGMNRISPKWRRRINWDAIKEKDIIIINGEIKTNPPLPVLLSMREKLKHYITKSLRMKTLDVCYMYMYMITCEYVSWMRTCTLSLDNEDDCVGVRTRVQTSASLSRYHNLNVDILLLTLLYVIVLFIICYWHFVLFKGRVNRLIVHNLSDFFYTQ